MYKIKPYPLSQLGRGGEVGYKKEGLFESGFAKSMGAGYFVTSEYFFFFFENLVVLV